jgi:hypothetical protein
MPREAFETAAPPAAPLSVGALGPTPHGRFGGLRRAFSRILLLACGNVCWFVATSVHAQEAKAPNRAVGAEVRARPQPEAEAEAQYAAGERRYNLGEYGGAASAFERSYELSGLPELLFDIGQAHRLAGPEHCAAARRSYSAYLRSVPNTPHEKEVRARLVELGDCGPAGDVRATPAPLPASPTGPGSAAHDARHQAPSALRLVLVGGGAATLAAGGILYARVRIKYNDVADGCPCPRGQFDTWQNLAYASYALMAVGAAAGVVGLTLWQTTGPTPRAALSITPGGLQLTGAL